MIMYHTCLLTSTIHQFLLKIDEDLAKKLYESKCHYCGDTLHRADYPRSPHGLSEADCDFYQFRLSFCCKTCRRRHTSQSVRFFGRRWYVSSVFILINALSGGWSYKRRSRMIKRHLGINISERTWRRWCLWWRKYFEETKFWRQAKGLIPLDCRSGPFPRRLLGMYPLLWDDRFLSVLGFFAPLTAGAFRAV